VIIMSVSIVRIPTFVNAVDLSNFIMEKRKGDRVQYTTTTSPTLDEINSRLLSAEASVVKLMNTQWRPDLFTKESSWVKYGRPNYTRWAHRNIYNRKQYPTTITTLKSPIISLDKLEIVYAGQVVDIVASADWTEGWFEDYYVDYRNGIIEFRRKFPNYRTPVNIEYTQGRIETDDGYAVRDGVVLNLPAPTETSISATMTTIIGQYNGKLLKITSGPAADSIYRVHTSTHLDGLTTFNVLDGYTMVADGIVSTDTFEVYVIPHDIQEMVLIYTYLGLLIVDPTYQHNLENPFDEPNPLFRQWEWLAGRFNVLLEQRRSTIQLVN